LSLWRDLTAFDGHGGSNEQEIEASPFVAFELALSL
jgi:hypothetical protein